MLSCDDGEAARVASGAFLSPFDRIGHLEFVFFVMIYGVEFMPDQPVKFAVRADFELKADVGASTKMVKIPIFRFDDEFAA